MAHQQQSRLPVALHHAFTHPGSSLRRAILCTDTLVDFLSHFEQGQSRGTGLPNGASINLAYRESEREFLQRYVFRGLGARRVAFDAKEIPHFTPPAFLQVLERCQRFGVRVYGVEIFSGSGEAIHTHLSSDGLPYSLLPAVIPFSRFEEVTACGTFGVPEALLSAPAITQELINAYTESEYDVHAGELIISVRVGERNAELARLLADRSEAEAYLLTACSPFSRGRRDSDKAESATLRLDLEQAGATVLPAVAAGGTAWEETGFLALGLAESDAHRLGDEYGQNALVAVRSDGFVELVLLR